jgi:hypothetical protein
MPSAVTHFYSGQPMHFCSGVDTAGALALPVHALLQPVNVKHRCKIDDFRRVAAGMDLR